MHFTASHVVADGFAYTECPRWHDGELWFSDQYGGAVYRLRQPEGNAQLEVAVPHRPAGLGWLPSGELLVVSMEDHRLLRWDGSRLDTVADLSAWQGGPANDMAVDCRGRAYVGNIGFDYYAGEEPRTTDLLLVDAIGGAVEVAATDVLVPNGCLLSADGARLVLAESFRHQLTEFDIATDGRLCNRRQFADLDGFTPDGICWDRDGESIWFAALDAGVRKVRRGGDVVAHVQPSRARAYACVVGGDDLYLCTSDSDVPADAARSRRAAIEIARLPDGSQ